MIIVRIASALAVASSVALFAQSDTTPPAVTTHSPAAGATGVSTGIVVKVTLSEPIQTPTLTFELRNSSNSLIAASVAFDEATHTAALTPLSELPGNQVFTAQASGARDLAGNIMTPVSWSFTTATAGFQDIVLPQTGLVDPTVMQFAADGRLFVAEKSGRVYVFDDLADASPTLAIDLRTNVHNYWDRGLLGMALHPNFPSVPYVYVLYAYDAVPGGTAPRWGAAGQTSDGCPNPPGATANGCVVTGRLSRLNVGNPSGWPLQPANEEVLVTDWFQQFPSHSTGSLAFGADGALYASAGDGASFNYADYGQTASTPPAGDPPNEGGALRSQDIRTSSDPVTLDGSIIRLDPDTGAALPDNPRASDPDDNGKRLVAHGLRNPFRFTIRPGTNELWIADVGWGTWEEINRVVDGSDSLVENFGWPCYEGALIQSGYDGLNVPICETIYGQAGTDTPPYYTYRHSSRVVAGEACPTGSSSVSGVAFYPQAGPGYPSAYRGALFFSDYSRNCIWAMRPDASGLPNPVDIVTIRSGAGGPVHLVSGPGGDIFYAGLNDDRLHRIRYSAGNLPPSAVAQASPTEGPLPLTVSFSATTSSDPEGQALTYAWDLDGDGAFDDATSAAPTFTYTTDGPVTVRLRVTDPGGLSDVAAVTVWPGNVAPVATIDSPASTFTWSVGESIAFSGSGTDREDGSLPPSAMEWRLIVHHCPSNCHPHDVQTVSGVASGTFAAPDHEYPSHLELRLTVTDSGGVKHSVGVLLEPRTVQLTFASAPSGLQLSVNGASAATPFSRTVIVGSSNSLAAPTPQTLGATSYEFAAWSHGGEQVHNVTAPGSPATYTATYVRPPDATPPTVALTSPPQGSVLRGLQTLVASASDDSGVVTGVQFFVGGTPLGPPDMTAPYSATWDTTGFNGVYSLAAAASDEAGNTGVSNPVTVSVDNIPPTVSLTAPAAGAVGGTITVAASASDAGGLVDVQFRVDGTNIGSPDPTAPYSVVWDSSSVSNGAHSLTAVARDVAGNLSVSAAVGITVSNWQAPAGLVAAYAFDEGAGTSTADETGNGHTGALQGGATWTPGGKFGGALAFNGSNGLVSIADAAALDFASSLTVEAWIYPTVRSNWDTVLFKGAGNATAYALYAGDSAGRPAAVVRLGSKERSLNGSSVLPLNTWSHLAMTFGGGRLRIYVNGSLVADRTWSGSVRKTGAAVTIGGSLVYGRWFAGLIDEVRLYNRELTVEEIQAGMSQTIRP